MTFIVTSLRSRAATAPTRPGQNSCPDCPIARRIDLLVHLAAFILIFAALPYLLEALSGGDLDPAATRAVLVYTAIAAGLVFTSMSYHHAPLDRWRGALLKADQSAIFIKIVGTYTALAALAGADLGHVLEALWIVTLAGCALRIFGPRPMRRLNLTLYLALALIGFWATKPAIDALTPAARDLVLLAGIFYLAGIPVFVMDRLRFRKSIWHSAVFIATGLVYAAIIVEVAAGGMPLVAETPHDPAPVEEPGSLTEDTWGAANAAQPAPGPRPRP